jgi:hypothetical protein
MQIKAKISGSYSMEFQRSYFCLYAQKSRKSSKEIYGEFGMHSKAAITHFFAQKLLGMNF